MPAHLKDTGDDSTPQDHLRCFCLQTDYSI